MPPSIRGLYAVKAYCGIVSGLCNKIIVVLASQKVDVQIFDLPESVEKNAVAKDVRDALRATLSTPPTVLVCQVAWGAVIDDINFDPEPDDHVRLHILNELGEGFAITNAERTYLISTHLLPMLRDRDWREIQVLATALFTAAERRKYLREIFSLATNPSLLLPRRLSNEGSTMLGNGLRVNTDFATTFRRAYVQGSGPIVLAGFMPAEYPIQDIVDNLTPTRFSSSTSTRFLARSALRVGLVSAALLRDSGASPTVRRSPVSTSIAKASYEICEMMPSLRRMDA